MNLPLEAFDRLETASVMLGKEKNDLKDFLMRCEEAGEVSMALLYHDLSSSYATLTRRFCTPKSPCLRWNCACDKHVRAEQAVAPVVAALFLLPSLPGQEGGTGGGREGGRAFFLPLAPSSRQKKHKTASTSSSSSSFLPPSSSPSSYSLPLRELGTTVYDRWICLAMLLQQPQTTKIFFSAQVNLFPFFGFLLRQQQCHPSFLRSLVDVKVAGWVLQEQLKENDLEYLPLLARVFPSGGLPPPPVLQAGEMGGKVTRAVREVLQQLHSTRLLWHRMQAQLHQRHLMQVFRQVEMPLLPLLSAMEVYGVGFAVDKVHPLVSSLEAKRRLLQSLIYQEAGLGSDWNIESPEQVADVLYTKLRLPPPPLTTTGKHASTSEAHLEQIKEKHPVIPSLLRYRTLAKSMRAFLESLPRHATRVGALQRQQQQQKGGGEGGDRIHAQWLQCMVRTGRLSSQHPNMQTIPKELELEGDKIVIRDLFCASEGTVLLAADYSQVEMRVLAALSRDPRLCQLFRQEGDVYCNLMSELLKKPPAAISKAERNQAKVVTLGLIYGMGAAAASKKLGTSVQGATHLINSFFQAYPFVRRWMEETKAHARKHGFVCTMLGRRRLLSSINASDPASRSQAERQSVNSIIQGSAADLMKLAMIALQTRVDQAWTEGGGEGGGEGRGEGGRGKPALVLQIHDELVFECPREEKAVLRLKALVKEAMEEGALQLCPPGSFQGVPLVVKLSVGMTLGSLVEVR